MTLRLDAGVDQFEDRTNRQSHILWSAADLFGAEVWEARMCEHIPDLVRERIVPISPTPRGAARCTRYHASKRLIPRALALLERTPLAFEARGFALANQRGDLHRHDEEVRTMSLGETLRDT